MIISNLLKNLRIKTMAILEENRDEKLHERSLANNISIDNCKQQKSQKKIDQSDFIKIRSIYASKKTICGLKRLPTGWQNKDL